MGYNKDYNETVPTEKGKELSIGETITVESGDGDTLVEYVICELESKEAGVKVRANKPEGEKDNE